MLNRCTNELCEGGKAMQTRQKRERGRHSERLLSVRFSGERGGTG